MGEGGESMGRESSKLGGDNGLGEGGEFEGGDASVYKEEDTSC